VTKLKVAFSAES